VRNDRRLTVRLIELELGLNQQSVQKILVDDLQMQKVCAKMVPRFCRKTKSNTQCYQCESAICQKRNHSFWSPSLFPRCNTLWLIALSQAKKCGERNSFFIFRWNQECSDKGVKESPGGEVFQMLPRVAGTNA